MATRKPTSLSDYIHKGLELPEEVRLELAFEVLGKRCRKDTKEKLYRRLGAVCLLPNYGIFGRVDIEQKPDGSYACGYTAGQSYPDEIRTVRELILKG